MASTILSCDYKYRLGNRKERQARSPGVPTKIDPENRKKFKHNLLVCLQTLIWQVSALDHIKLQFQLIWNRSKREKKIKGVKKGENEDGECVRSTKDLQDLEILRLWRLSTTNHHFSRWLWGFWWHTHAKGLRYCETSKGLIRQDCYRREYHIWLALDQSSESDCSLGPRLREDH